MNVFKNKVLLLLLLLASSCVSVLGQTPKHPKGYYKNQMLQLQSAIEKHFYDSTAGFYRETTEVEPGKNPYSYLWPLCGMIQAANEIEKVTVQKGLVEKTLDIIMAYYDTAAPAPGYASYIMKLKGGDRFYDDNQWIGIAAMDAYSRLHTKKYLAVGKEIYRYMMTGFDTVLGGGLYWQEPKKTSKNTCSNGPGVILAIQLYKATKNKHYLDTALLLYNWVNEKLKAPNGLYYDNVQVKTGKVEKPMFSYNTGTMLQSNVYLYEAMGDKKYLAEAINIADSAQVYFTGKGKFRDSYWFNAVLLRSYQHLLQYHPNLKYIRSFQACVDFALENNLNSDHLAGREKTLDLVNQSGLLEIVARLALLETKYNL